MSMLSSTPNSSATFQGSTSTLLVEDSPVLPPFVDWSQLSDTETPLPSFFRYEPRWQMLLCVTHGVFCCLDDIEGHLSTNHRWLAKNGEPITRAQMMESARRLNICPTASAFTPPAEIVPVIRELGQPYEGFECTYDSTVCRYRTRAKNAMTGHLTKVHQFKNSVGWGQIGRYQPYWCGPIQQLMSRGKCPQEGYIRVDWNGPLYRRPYRPRKHPNVDPNENEEEGRLSLWPPCGIDSTILLSSPPLSTDPPSSPPTNASFIPDSQQWSSPCTAGAANLQAHPDQTDAWLQRTRWQEIFGDRNRWWIRQSSRPATTSVSAAYDTSIDLTCQHTEQLCDLMKQQMKQFWDEMLESIHESPYYVRRKLVSLHAGSIGRRHFKPLNRPRTVRQYGRTWLRCLLIIIRMSRFNRPQQRQRWGIPLPRLVQNRAHTLYRRLEELDRQCNTDSNPRGGDWEGPALVARTKDQVVEAMFNLSLLLVCPNEPEPEPHRYPLVYAAAVLALTESDTFVRVQEYTKFLAHLIYVGRAVFLHVYHPKGSIMDSLDADENDFSDPFIYDNDDDDDPIRSQRLSQTDKRGETGLESAEDFLSEYEDEDRDDIKIQLLSNDEESPPLEPSTANQQYAYILRRFERKQERYLLFESRYPFAELIDLLRTGHAAAKVESGISQVFWTNNYQSLRLNNQQTSFTIKQFRTMAQHSLSTAVEALNALLYGMKDHQDLSQVNDQLTNRQKGYSVVTGFDNDKARAVFVGHLQLLVDRSSYGPFVANHNWNGARVAHYAHECTEAIRLAMVATHIWSGQPGRAPELAATKFRNGPDVDRNLFWVDDVMMIRQRYNKSTTVAEEQGGICRFLPPPLSTALLRFLLYVRPALSFMLHQVTPLFHTNDYLFRSYVPTDHKGAPECWGTLNLSRALQKLSSPFGLDLNVQKYRQIAVALGYQFITPEQRHIRDVNRQHQQLLDQQAGHQKRTANHHYNQDGDYPPTMQPRKLHNLYDLSIAWHDWLASPLSPSAPVDQSSASTEANSPKQSRPAPKKGKPGTTVVNQRPAAPVTPVERRKKRPATSSPGVSTPESTSSESDARGADISSGGDSDLDEGSPCLQPTLPVTALGSSHGRNSLKRPRLAASKVDGRPLQQQEPRSPTRVLNSRPKMRLPSKVPGIPTVRGRNEVPEGVSGVESASEEIESPYVKAQKAQKTQKAPKRMRKGEWGPSRFRNETKALAVIVSTPR